MNMTNRLFTYPVLSDEKDDYVKSFFNVDYEQAMQGVNSLKLIIPIGRLNGSFDAVAFILLKKNVANFSCADWVHDYSEMTFNLFAGTILAYQNLPSLDIAKEYEKFANAGSIFSSESYRRNFEISLGPTPKLSAYVSSLYL